MSKQGKARGWDRDRMNLVGFEEHQVGDLVFAQVYYLYILLEATCHGHCILSSLIFYFERHVTVGYFT